MTIHNDCEVTSEPGAVEFACRDCGSVAYRPANMERDPARCYICAHIAASAANAPRFGDAPDVGREVRARLQAGR